MFRFESALFGLEKALLGFQSALFALDRPLCSREEARFGCESAAFEVMRESLELEHPPFVTPNISLRPKCPMPESHSSFVQEQIQPSSGKRSASYEKRLSKVSIALGRSHQE